MAKKIKVSRKKIKQPDEFQTFTDRAFKYFNENKQISYSVIGGAILALVLASGISYTVKTRRAKADRLLIEAFSIINAPLAGQMTQASLLQGGRNYSTGKERAEEAIKKLTEVSDQFGSGEAGIEARFHLGEAYFEKGDYAGAIASYQDFLKHPGKNASVAEFLQDPAYLGLAKAYYGAGDFANAEQYFQKVIDAKLDAYLAEADLGLARVLIKKGEPDKAKEKLKLIMESYPGSIYDQLAKIELNNLSGAEAVK